MTLLYLLKLILPPWKNPHILRLDTLWYQTTCVTGCCLAGASYGSTSVCTQVHHRAGEGDEAHLRGSQHPEGLVIGAHTPCGAQSQVSPHANDMLPMYKQGTC